MKRPLLFFLTAFFFLFSLSAQNLVKNPSFENYNYALCQIVDDFSGVFNDWQSPNDGAGDVYFTNINQECYYLQPSNTYTGPIGQKGTETPYDGEVMSGIWVYTISGLEQREYVMGELETELEIGKTYQISLKISLADFMEYYIGELGIAFVRQNEIELDGDRVLNTPQVAIDLDMDTYEGWVNFVTTFTSDGNYDSFIIGNFLPDDNSLVFPNPNASGSVGTYGAYYFIDDVWIGESKPVSLTEQTLYSMTIYPNPAMDLLRLEFPQTVPASVQVYNQLGQIVMERNKLARLDELDCSVLAPGLYSLGALDRNGRLLSQKTFMVVSD